MGMTKTWLPNILVLGSLAGVAVVGHETDWTFTEFAHHSSHADDTTHETHKPAEQEVPNFTFSSVEDLAKAGVEMAEVESRPMEEMISASGVVTYAQDSLAELSSRVPGVVWNVCKQLGDIVEKGEVLAILDCASVGEAKADFLQSMVRAEAREETVARLQGAGDAVPMRQLREAEALLREARVARFNAQQRLINLGLIVNHEDLKGLSDEERSARIHFLALPHDLVSSLDRSTITANLLPLAAPFSGVLIKREMVVGEHASPDRGLLTIADLDRMWLKLNVSKEDSSRVAIGQEVQFIADGVNEPAIAEVDWINTQVDEKTRTVQLLAHVANPLLSKAGGPVRALRANTFGMGRIRVRHAPSILTVPDIAVHRDGHSHFVFTVKDSDDQDYVETFCVEPREVQVGLSAGGFTEILGGLSVGERVATSGSHVLKSEFENRLVAAAP